MTQTFAHMPSGWEHLPWPCPPSYSWSSSSGSSSGGWLVSRWQVTITIGRCGSFLLGTGRGVVLCYLTLEKVCTFVLCCASLPWHNKRCGTLLPVTWRGVAHYFLSHKEVRHTTIPVTLRSVGTPLPVTGRGVTHYFLSHEEVGRISLINRRFSEFSELPCIVCNTCGMVEWVWSIEGSLNSLNYRIVCCEPPEDGRVRLIYRRFPGEMLRPRGRRQPGGPASIRHP